MESSSALFNGDHFPCILLEIFKTLSVTRSCGGRFIPGEWNKIWGAVISSGHVQGGPKKVSLIIFAITLSTASQFS